MKNDVKKFRIINTIEGYSYLVLLFIAMPMKYIMGITIATRVAGSIHGMLFIAFMGLLFLAWKEAEWTMKENALFFIASLIPFGTFYTKHKIKAYESRV
jgi:integral membrane protein